jgi:GNAT superfamily N-acetyltransferase
MSEHIIRKILNVDPIWSAYALVDLAPQHSSFCQWHHSEEGVVLAYHGLTPPVFFAAGATADVVELTSRIPPGEVQFTLLPEHRASLAPVLSVQSESLMWRMLFSGESPEIGQEPGCRRLAGEDLEEVTALFADHPDRPDSFHPRQLEEGPFYGVYHEKELVAIAGIHVLDEDTSMAAIGNVFTGPAHRGRGFGRRASAELLRELRRMKIQTIVLNVAQKNRAAVNLYQDLEFQPHCGYHEGLGELVELPRLER